MPNSRLSPPSEIVPANRFGPASPVRVRVNLERIVPSPVELGPSPKPNSADMLLEQDGEGDRAGQIPAGRVAGHLQRARYAALDGAGVVPALESLGLITNS